MSALDNQAVVSAKRSFSRFATIIASLTAPLAVYWLWHSGVALWLSVFLGVLMVGAFRGAADLIFKRLVEQPKLSLDAAREDMDADALARRRHHFWARKFRLVAIWAVLTALIGISKGGFAGAVHWETHVLSYLTNPSVLQQLIILPIFFLANFLLFFGPMMMMGISQMRGLEPGDADFGVKLEDVRGQKEAKEEIRKVVTLWQAGEHFVKHGGKRERGILFLGAPGVGKTMLAKAIATGFNCPIVLMPGSGFAQTFIGMDVIIVRYMARKARKLAAKWGGSCIVFIDEIDAVGMRRAALGNSKQVQQVPGGGMGGMMGGMGQMGLQSLLVVMDGIDNPPFFRRVLTNKVNLYLDALYVLPVRVKFFGTKTLQLRLPKAKPTGNQIFFVGATNVPLESLDPALTRAGRMGRHIYFRVPTKRDRIDIFDLYMSRVSHDDELDSTVAREELARITDGYSPAQIEQVCSIALTYALHDERSSFSRSDLLEAMVTVEAGTALGWGYESDEEERSTAIHEAGHAVCSYLFEKDMEAVRLSIRKRGNTGGHLQSVETVERFAKFRGEVFNRLVTLLGAYAAENVFYGENTQGVAGDLQMTSGLAGMMVGRWGMVAPPIEYGEKPYTPEELKTIERKLEKLGGSLVTAAGPMDAKLDGGAARQEARIIGEAFVVAYQTILHNKMAVEKLADVLCMRKEIYGNDLLDLLKKSGLEAPDIDYGASAVWPTL